MKDLSNRQKELLITIFDSMKVYGKAPTYSEMVQNMDVSSKQAIADFLLQLNDKGYIIISENKHRGIYISAYGIKALVDYGAIKESMPQVLNGKIVYEYQSSIDNSAFLEETKVLRTIIGNLALVHSESNSSDHLEERFEPVKKSVNFTEFSSRFPAATGNVGQGHSFQNFQNNLFVVNQNLRKILSDNTTDFKPEIRTSGILSFLKTLFGV